MSSRTARRDEEEESDPEEHAHQAIQKKVFEDEQGDPIWFFLHKSISLDWQRNNLINHIESNGGIVRPNDSNVDTVLVDVNSPACNKDNLQLAYNSHRDPSKRKVWVEPMSFVSRCLREGVVRHRQPEPKGMGGSLRLERTSFTHEDDENLARYLAIRIPDVKNGGRRGEGVYKELYKAYSEDHEEYAWVNRHTWQSWRNRYNKNVIRFHDMIDIYVELEKPERKQAYGLRRKNDGWQWPDEPEEDEEQPGNSAKRRRVDLSPGSPENRATDISGNEIRLLGTRKGKEKAIPEEEVNDAHHESSSFHQSPVASEPGPSKRTPITTYSSRRTRVSSPSRDPEPYTSQATLVEPSHQTQEPRPPTRAISHSPVQRDNNQNGLPLTLKEPDVSVVLVSSTQTSGAGANMKPASTFPQHRPLARKIAWKPTPSDSTPMTPSDPPYRNTRSRSRFIEPSNLPLRSKTRHKRGSRGTTLSLLEEVVNENYAPSVEALEADSPPAEPMETHPTPSGETWEERNVLDLLVNISERSQATEEESQFRAKEYPSARSAEDDGGNESKSMDPDDVQTDRWLRQQAGVRLSLEELDISPDEMLRRFREASINTARSSRGPSVRSVPLPQARANFATRPRHSAPVYNRGVFGGPILTTRQPRTPATNPQSKLRQRSTSSIESFPIAGTKASAAKKNIETEEKRTPYRPPVGTRAALLTKEQPRVRKAALSRDREI